MSNPPCIFCEIVAGRAEASVVRADERTLAFMNLVQPNEGHVLVVPRRHVESVDGLDDIEAAALMLAVLRVARAVRTAFQPDGINLWQNNGAAAGQDVWHVHMHVVPRFAGDGLVRYYPQPYQPAPRSTLNAIARRLRDVLERG